MKLNMSGVDYTLFPKHAETLLALKNREFKELMDMTPHERAEFERLQEYVDRMARATDNAQGASSSFLDGMRQQTLIEQMGRMQEGTGSEIARLRAEIRRLEEDRSYWISRTKVLESMLSQSPAAGVLPVAESVHMEYLTKMVREEMGIRMRNDPNKMKLVNDPEVRWNNPGRVIAVIQSLYGKQFSEVLTRPLDPEGQEPYWQQYVKRIAARSPKDAAWVEDRIRVHQEVQREWSERNEIRRTFTERTSHYLKSIYHITSSDVQQMIEKVAGSIDAELGKFNWMELDPAGVDRLMQFTPDRLNITREMLEESYDRNNLDAWTAALGLYLKKLSLCECNLLKKTFDWKTGYRPIDPPAYAPEELTFSGPR